MEATTENHTSSNNSRVVGESPTKTNVMTGLGNPADHTLLICMVSLSAVIVICVTLVVMTMSVVCQPVQVRFTSLLSFLRLNSDFYFFS